MINLCGVLAGAAIVFAMAGKPGFALFCAISAAVIFINFRGK
jgi:hypothetical protein